jgi:predicted DNA-binding transcriptional regulator AlpA
MDQQAPSRLLTTDEAAAFLSLKRKTLENWRVVGGGPKFIRAGGRIAYDPRDIEAWVAARRVSNTSEPVAA